MKVCSKCKIEKEESEFRKRDKKKSGLFAWCTPCEVEYKSHYYIINREKIKNKSKEYGRKHKPQKKQYRKEYYQKNKEKILLKSMEYVIDHRDRVRVNKRKWAENNKDRTSKTKTDWYIKNKEMVLKEDKERRDSLSDSYIVRNLKNLGVTENFIEYNPEIIDVKRTILKITRKIKQNGNTNNKKKKNLFKRSWL